VAILRFNAGYCTSEQRFPDSLDNPRCHNYLKPRLYSLLKKVDVLTRTNLWLMHDDAPPQFLLAGLEFLDVFLEQWMGPTAEPARAFDETH